MDSIIIFYAVAIDPLVTCKTNITSTNQVIDRLCGGKFAR